MYEKYGKRILDIVISVLVLIVLAIPFAILAAAIKLDSKGPILFCQTRVGKNKKPFTIYKFRTMRTDAPREMPTHLLQHPMSYITRLGRFLRVSSLDELPQLLNIVKGDMSLVGPRPVLFRQTFLVEARDANGANTVRPGLTGLAQSHGRDELTEVEKARLDGEYTKKITFFEDIRIILVTFKIVLRAEGYKEGASR